MDQITCLGKSLACYIHASYQKKKLETEWRVLQTILKDSEIFNETGDYGWIQKDLDHFR